MLIDEKAGKLAPGLLQFRNEVLSTAQLLETMVAATRGNAPKPNGGPEPQAETSLVPAPYALPGPDAGAETALTTDFVGRIRSRAEAYSLLEEIAAFLHQTDPHSPTPYLISRAVSWGDMHFDELLPELVRDNGELSDIIKLLRIEVPAKKPR
jgi:type VI secretion system protein ImpA